LKGHIYEKDRIVIGGTLNSLIYAYLNDLPVLFVEVKTPFMFDTLPAGLDLRGLSLPHIHSKEVTEQELLQHIMIGSSLAGNIPLSDSALSIRINEKMITVATQFRKLIKFKYNKLIVFDDTDIHGLSDVSSIMRKPSRVIDWINVRAGCVHDHDVLMSNNHFVSKAYFYPSFRTDNSIFKDVYAESFLSDKHIFESSYTETMARHKVTKMMKTAGINGPANGTHPNNPTLPIYNDLKLESSKREVYHNIIKKYTPDPRFEYRDDTIVELLENSKHRPSYARKLVKGMFE